MRPRVIFCSLILVLVSPGWTASGHAASQPKPDAVIVSQKSESPPARLESAEVKWRVLAVRRQGTDHCPAVDGWASDDWLLQSLRDPKPVAKDYGPRSNEPSRPKLDLRQVVAAAPLLHQLGLDRVCAYQAVDPAKPFPALLPAGLMSAGKAHMALVTAGDLDPESATILARHFLDQTDGMPPPSIFNPESHPVGPPRPPVRLVFLDTQPDGEGVPHTSSPTTKHGYTLVHLAAQLVCPQDVPCPVELATALALPHQMFHPDQPPSESIFSSLGGNLGLVDELASAIVREVWKWSPDAKRKHLILNLSLGWDGELLNELDHHKVAHLEADSQLVYKALQLARQSGALVIAAAGNRRGGGESKWPLLPAAWELRRPSLLRFLDGSKPVYAVGGVDWQGLPLPNYRQGGLPRRVAFGDHAVAATSGTDDPTAMYTGSSVSTAVVSAIAAVVWQLRPELSAAEVMRLLGRSGDVLPTRADSYAWKDLWPLSKMMGAPNVRRLTLCQAVVQARVEGGLGNIPSCRRPKKAAADLSTLITALPSTSLTLQATTLPTYCRSASDPTPLLFADPAHGLADPCPLYRWPDIVSQRWVAPQPDDPPCPGCSFIPPHAMVGALAFDKIPPLPAGYVLAVGIDPKWRLPNYNIDSASLDVDRYSGAGKFIERRTYAIPQDVLRQLVAATTNRLLLPEVGNRRSLVGCTVTLNFKVTVDGKPYSVQSPVYVDP
jgi:hypothetical protein